MRMRMRMRRMHCSKAQARIQTVRGLRLEYSRGGRAVCYVVVRKGAAVGKKKQRQSQEASNEATTESVQTERLFAWQLS